ncbi:MAG: group III truncated hemoglobin [Bacteroidetes bacterium]|nr:group III truncated hemoglobin [Bacteroidota bacterium]
MNENESQPVVLNDIKTMEDIQLLVDRFYQRVRENKLLGPIFAGVIGDQWPKHLEKMYRFWQTILLEEHTYFGRPFPPHAKMPLTQEHFDTWLGIWQTTVNELFAGEKADEAKWRGDKMATLFRIKLDAIKQGGFRPLL